MLRRSEKKAIYIHNQYCNIRQIGLVNNQKNENTDLEELIRQPLLLRREEEQLLNIFAGTSPLLQGEGQRSGPTCHIKI